MLKGNKTNKKAVITAVVIIMLLFGMVEVGILLFDHFSKNTPNKSNYLFKDNMVVYGVNSSQKGMQYGILNKKGKVLIEAKFDAVIPLGENRMGIAKITEAEKSYAIADIKGNMLTEFEFSSLKRFSGEVAAVFHGGKWGYIDTNGKWAVKPVFDNAHSFSEGVASVSKNGKWFFIDKKGKNISKDSFDAAGSLKRGVAKVKKDGKWGYIDVTFNWLIKPRYDMVRNFSGGLAAVCKNGKWGYIDSNFKEVIKPQYKTAKDFKNGLAPVANDEGYFGYINSEGKLVIPYKEQIINANHFSSSNRAAVWGFGTYPCWNYINSEGKFMDKPVYSWAGDFYGSIAPVCYLHNQKYTFINIDMKPITDSYYKYISNFYEDGYCLIQNDQNKWFAINKKGIPILQKEFDEIISGNDIKWFLNK